MDILEKAEPAATEPAAAATEPAAAATEPAAAATEPAAAAASTSSTGLMHQYINKGLTDTQNVYTTARSRNSQLDRIFFGNPMKFTKL